LRPTKIAHPNSSRCPYAEIACTGRVFVDMRGVRTERAEILRIALPKKGWPDQRAFETARRLLRERYRVPVSGLQAVPGWVKNNRRHQGPPPDEVNLDLDLDKLDLYDCGGNVTTLGAGPSDREHTRGHNASSVHFRERLAGTPE
jgi:hypothetical protein